MDYAQHNSIIAAPNKNQMASKELNSTDFIQHHLQNLTFGECSDGKWRFADHHINIGKAHVEHEPKTYTCDVKEMGFKGAMVNGFTQKDVPDSAIYYDIPEYRSFWDTVSKLDVPFYLHPRMQLPSRSPIYDGHPWLKSAPWGFAVETSIHSLRMCGSGMFDDYPNLKIFIGHLGEHIPYDLWRIDARMRFSRRDYRGKRPLGEYFLDNFMITTSGNFSDPAFRCALEVVGVERMFFSADYPFETMEDACEWFDSTTVISEKDRIKIGRTNAIKYFDLDLE